MKCNSPGTDAAYDCSNRRGFTLIEILVVISIIVLLIAMLLPALGQARDNAKSVLCKTNLSAAGKMITAYVVENRSYPGHHTVNGPAWAVWPSRSWKYGDVRSFHCPEADSAFQWERRYGSGLSKQYGYAKNEVRITPSSGFSYGYNDWGVKEFTNPHLGLGGHVGHPVHGEVGRKRVRVPSNMILLADSTSDFFWDTAIDPKDQNSTAEMPGRRHFAGANVLFCDNRVEFDTQANLISRDPSLRRRWNNDNDPHLELNN